MKDSYSIEDIAHETLKTFALTRNYNLWIINMLKPFIANDILEVGCGIGNLTFYLRHLGQLTCLDKSQRYIDHMKIDYPEIKFYCRDISNVRVCSIVNERFNTIVCVNVLEHVEKDLNALTNMFALLKQKGRLLLYVPALMGLYGTMDEELGHFRRYEKNELERKLRHTGFTIERFQYSNFLSMIGWFINGKILRSVRVSVPQSLLFDKLVPLLARMERIAPPMVGMSLFAVARKQK